MILPEKMIRKIRGVSSSPGGRLPRRGCLGSKQEVSFALKKLITGWFRSRRGLEHRQRKERISHRERRRNWGKRAKVPKVPSHPEDQNLHPCAKTKKQRFKRGRSTAYHLKGNNKKGKRGREV